VADTTVASDFNQPLNIKCDVAAKVALNTAVVVYIFSEFRRVVFRQISYTDTRVNACFSADLVRRFTADSEYISKSNLDALIPWQINACYTRHTGCTSMLIRFAPLTLALFMLRVFTDHHDLALALDDLALFAHFLYRRSDFHWNALLAATLFISNAT
jgi:hypothetical protein